MKIELRTVKVRDLITDYKDAQEKGVTAWGGLKRPELSPEDQSRPIFVCWNPRVWNPSAELVSE